ncbi:hypothetical protein QJQ45_018120, partial [Haematococcus lacustris]
AEQAARTSFVVAMSRAALTSLHVSLSEFEAAARSAASTNASDLDGLQEMLSKLTAAAAATRQAAPALLRSGSQDDRHATAEALLNLSARAWSLGQALKQAILMGPLVAPLWSWGTLLSQMQATEDSSSAPQPNCANALITHLCHIATDLHALVPLSLPGLVLLPSALAAERLRMCLRVSKDWALQGQLEKAEAQGLGPPMPRRPHQLPLRQLGRSQQAQLPGGQLAAEEGLLSG